ncbi:LacI family transcriptional regulator [Paenibacillus taihuensis]|uniref:LacI family transcriptional regulator n=1 Tax=Paenibacillus taihuensis TaxID=1156355 RepID=A0A3D9QUQ0_9BACL|nr:DNA-binding transcriptional regulator [Paenibacillus taihuensis]REE67970.1 LacI family transcriptional regulator [Paenibacillus taihuensis]
MSLFTSPKRKQVALLIETSNEYARGLLGGIKNYLREHASSWSVTLGEYSRGSNNFAWLDHWNGDGIIARIENEQTARFIREKGLPAIDVSASRRIPSLPCVETNDQSIAAMAAEHFLERGFKHFAFYGDSRFKWSDLRGEAYQAYLQAQGYECLCFEMPADAAHEESWHSSSEELIRWLKELPKPVGIMACYDIRGQQLLEACRYAGVAVPDEAAVIGVDNDELLCELSTPPLSSIQTNALKTGYLAAQLLERMMAGETIEEPINLIEPINIQVRLSSHVLAVEDKMVSDVIRFIRDHAHEEIQVQHILDQFSVSRRVLDSRFQKALGRTPHDEILAVKLNHVKKLLVDTKLNLATIAERTGFKHTEYMSVAFMRATGIRPGEYRKNKGVVR